MLLFFYFFSVLFLVTFLFIMALLFSELKLKISRLELSRSDTNFELKYSGRIGIYFLGKIKLLSIKINQDKIKKISKADFIKQKIESLKENNEYQKKLQRQISKIIIKQIKEKAQINTFKLRLFLDTKNVIFTSYLVGVISAVIPNVVRGNIKNFNKRYFKFEISPIYKNYNFIYLKFDSIISIKVVHIINMFKVIGGMKNERSSDRRLNVNCYGKH